MSHNKKNKANINILVVDKDNDCQQILRGVLIQEGYEVVSVSTYEDGLKLARQKNFQIVIVDLTQTGLKDFDIIQHFKDITAGLCVIVTTESPSIKSAVEAIRQGAYDYISKPFELEEVRLILKRAVERHYLLHEAIQKEYYRELSILDGLTGLYNYRYFQEIVSREVARAKRYPQEFSLLMLDIDEFKKYNDTYGHLKGDELLKRLSEFLVGSIRFVDMVFRYGGEEFTILLPQTIKEGAMAVANRIINSIRQKMNITVSIGIASFPCDASTKEELVERADRALYQAKCSGKNQLCVFDKNSSVMYKKTS